MSFVKFHYTFASLEIKLLLCFLGLCLGYGVFAQTGLHTTTARSLTARPHPPLAQFTRLHIPEEAQNEKDEKPHSPLRATLFSAALPGLGQFYNKKYWKIPLIYAGFVGCYYLVNLNHGEYVKFRDEYTTRIDTTSNITPDPELVAFSDERIRQERDFYLNNLETTIVITLVWYLMNIIDANVDAHLYEFDVSDDLSMHWEPVFRRQAGGRETGISLSFRLKR